MRGALDAADQFDDMLALWSPPLQSVDQDILPQKEVADARTRDLLRNDAFTGSAAQLHKDSVVGDNFLLNATPEYKLLGKSKKWSDKFAEEVEAKFNIWAADPDDGPDASGKTDLTGLLRLAVGVYLASGEVLGVAEWIKRSGRSYHTAVSLVDLDRLRTPSKYHDDDRVVGGVRMDRYGQALGYYIHDRKQTDFYLIDDGAYKYVKKLKPWGRVQAFHILEQMRPEQTRGVSELVTALKQVKILSKFRDVTLQNAIVGGMFAATIESELPTEAVYGALGGESGSADNVNQYASKFLKGVSNYTRGGTAMKMDGVRIPHLYPGTKFNVTPVSTPGAIGQEFEAGLLRYLAAATGLSYEQLSRDYANTNYSSTRAAMLEVWRYMKARKKLVADRIANMVYKLWLEEAINSGDIDVGGIDIYHGRNFKYLAKADWIGAARGQIDTLKETQSAVLRMKFGLTTQRKEAAAFGMDWRKLNEQLEIEKKDRIERDIEWIEAKSIDAASGTPPTSRDPRNANTTKGKN